MDMQFPNYHNESQYFRTLFDEQPGVRFGTLSLELSGWNY